MPVRIASMVSAAALVALSSACSPRTEAPAPAAPPPATAATDVHQTMLTKVNPPATALWDIAAAAPNDDGDIDPAKVDAATWAKLLEAGKALEDAGKLLNTSTAFIAAAPGAKLQNEEPPEAPKAADVQRYIDAKPDEFRQHAAQLRSTGASIVAAVTQRDGKALGQLSNTLYENCESCHKAFWYPEQKEAQ
jgi:cytochrome c556